MKDSVLIIGPIFNTSSGPSGQGGALYINLKEAGLNVKKASHIRAKVPRFLHTLVFTLKKSLSARIIILQSFSYLAFIKDDAVSLIASLFKIPVIITLRGGAFYDFYQKYPGWVTRVLKRATLITTPSMFLKKQFEKHGFALRYLPNAIPLERFPYNRNVENKHSLLWVRAFNDIYHPELAIDTVNLLKSNYPDIHLTMIGADQGTLSSCISRIKKLQLEKNISILGYIPNNELSRFYSSHAVYINTTRYESFGVALMEAGACGIPCVSTSVGEIPYLWQDNKNIMLANRDAAEFSDKIKFLFSNPARAKEIGQAAKENAMKFNWPSILKNWIEIIEDYGIN